MRINLNINEVETVIWALKCMADFNDNPDVIEKFKDAAKRYKKPIYLQWLTNNSEVL